jgi:hypothetical protein
MPSPNPTATELVTTTLENRSGVIADNVSDNNALLGRLKKRGNIKKLSGGTKIYRELEYAENSTFMWYSGYQTLNISPSDVFTMAEFNWKQASIGVTISGQEQAINSGDDAKFDLIERRINNAEKTMKNQMSVAVYSDGTANGGLQVGGLQLLIADDPTTGTVGGINRATATNAFWRNQKWSATTDGGSAITAANIQRNMNGLYYKLVRGTDQPDLIVFANDWFSMYEQSLTTIQRITDSKTGDAGFQTLKFKGIDVLLDGGQDGRCPLLHGYFLNTEYLFYQPHKDRDMRPLGKLQPVNQDATAELLVWMGNMTMSNSALQGVMFQT